MATIRVLKPEGEYPFYDVMIHGKVISLSLAKLQELHIITGQDCADPDCPCRIAGYEEGQEAPKGKDHR